ncbi:MAG: hypothetical protein QNJ04_15780, partial [Desulfobacterales bacterium]|nr:hypothetical protein [Desulfobacterales bacterium]
MKLRSVARGLEVSAGRRGFSRDSVEDKMTWSAFVRGAFSEAGALVTDSTVVTPMITKRMINLLRVMRSSPTIQQRFVVLNPKGIDWNSDTRR